MGSLLLLLQQQKLKENLPTQCGQHPVPGRPSHPGGETPCSFPFPSHTQGRSWRPRGPAPSPVHRRFVVGVEGPGEGARRHLEIHGVGQHRGGRTQPSAPPRNQEAAVTALPFQTESRWLPGCRGLVPLIPRFLHSLESAAFRFRRSRVPPTSGFRRPGGSLGRSGSASSQVCLFQVRTA